MKWNRKKLRVIHVQQNLKERNKESELSGKQIKVSRKFSRVKKKIKLSIEMK